MLFYSAQLFERGRCNRMLFVHFCFIPRQNALYFAFWKHNRLLSNKGIVFSFVHEYGAARAVMFGVGSMSGTIVVAITRLVSGMMLTSRAVTK